MRRFACILGLILSLCLIAMGVYVLLEGMVTFEFNDGGVDVKDLNFSGLTVSSSSFGADFYTYSYRGTRAAANNLDSLGDYLEGAVTTCTALTLLLSGVGGLLLTMWGFGALKASKKRLALLKKIADA